jgi:hypothetical protein
MPWMRAMSSTLHPAKYNVLASILILLLGCGAWMDSPTKVRRKQVIQSPK